MRRVLWSSVGLRGRDAGTRWSGSRRVVPSVVGCVLLGLVAAGVPAAATPDREPAPLDCMAPAPDEASAAAAAQVCGVEVEVEAARTAWDTLYALPDGSRRLDTSIAAVRTDVSGEWAEIDTTIVEGSEGLEVASAVTPMVFSDGTAGQPLARITRDGHELVFGTELELTEPVVTGASVTYPEVLPGVDLVVTVNDDATGFTEVLRVGSPEAAANPALSDLTFPVEVSGGLELGARDGGFAATDASGEVVFRSPAPVMWDSSADELADQAVAGSTGLRALVQPALDAASDLARAAERLTSAVDGDVAVQMATRVADDGVTITPDTDVLTDPDTVWPVYIDPPVNGTRTEWVSIRNDGWTDYNYTGDQGVGRCGTTGSPMYCSSVFTRRAIWEFGGLQGVGDADPADIISATLRVYGTHSYSCTPAPINVHLAGDISSGTHWPGAWGSLLTSVSVAHKAACGNERWIEFDVSAAARAVADSGASSVHLGLVAGDESSSTGWKRYRYDATLSVEYNLAPNAPTGVGFTSPRPAACASGAGRPYVAATNPTISGVFTDRDPVPQSVKANVAVYGLPTGIGRSSLSAGQQLLVGERLTSPNGRTYLVLQSDGNLVMYGPSGAANWNTGTVGKGGVRLVMQGDGNLVLYTAGNLPVWHIGANGLGGTGVHQQDDGNLVVYTATGGVVWQSGTPNVSQVVWSGSSALQASGATHSVVVGGLLEGRSYRVQVNAVDAGGRAGPSVSCELTVDTQAPGTPTVTPVQGQPAVYAEGLTAGAPYVSGRFVFSRAGSADVVSYDYSFGDCDLDQHVASGTSGSSTPIAFAPDRSGTHTLCVRSVDRAGNPGAQKVYSFTVGFPGSTGTWLLDEGVGTVAYDGSPDGNHLTFPAGSWVDGPGAEAAAGLTDKARDVTSTTGDGHTDGPVVATDDPFSVMATVRLDSLTSTAIAVSQDGSTRAAFNLGFLKNDQRCVQETGTTECWAFMTYRFDAPTDGGEPAVVAVAPLQVQADTWVQLTGTYDGTQIRMYACELGGDPSSSEAATSFSAAWPSYGDFRVGRGFGPSGSGRWDGAAASVRAWDSALPIETIRAHCSAGS